MTTVIVVMGVAGCGKTTVGRVLAQQLNCPYVEADDYHSCEAKAKMSQGLPLTDADRMPWLERLARAANDSLVASDSTKTCVLSCSALRRSYRDVLRRGIRATTAVFVHLRLTLELARARLSHRSHFFNPDILHSQFETLEQLQSDELLECCCVVELKEGQTREDVIEKIRQFLHKMHLDG